MDECRPSQAGFEHGRSYGSENKRGRNDEEMEQQCSGVSECCLVDRQVRISQFPNFRMRQAAGERISGSTMLRSH